VKPNKGTLETLKANFWGYLCEINGSEKYESWGIKKEDFRKRFGAFWVGILWCETPSELKLLSDCKRVSEKNL